MFAAIRRASFYASSNHTLDATKNILPRSANCYRLERGNRMLRIDIFGLLRAKAHGAIGIGALVLIVILLTVPVWMTPW